MFTIIIATNSPVQSRSHPTGSPIYAIDFLFQQWRHGSWNRELEWVRSRSHKKQLERASRSQFNGTGAFSGVEAVNTRITATRTQKQEKFDVSMYIWHISFRHDCRLWHQYISVQKWPFCDSALWHMLLNTVGKQTLLLFCYHSFRIYMQQRNFCS